MKSSFLQSSTGNGPASVSAFEKLREFWISKGDKSPPKVHVIARHAKKVIVVWDELGAIVGSAIVHKTSVFDDRTKMLRSIKIPNGIEGIPVLVEIVKLFSKSGSFKRTANIFDDLGARLSGNRSKTYRSFDFKPNGKFFGKDIPAKVKAKE